ncbi:MAG: hypothetical protein C9355_00525 [Thalassolituus maritimus]|uniref:Iron uptake protein n=1 Tax=Thalassolituus maritimus TaxID=484498 RepID=A0A1N7KCD7_9GAMM|nr:hypothetical protein [Thalassolituus maritimus]TPD55958.1 MAG: hypothetical protein C9355_00525 [Thalassolituus maritimus]SIS59213.1 hypothetical protein SAMN05421686_102421 [Thalassolituus maritimus]
MFSLSEPWFLTARILAATVGGYLLSMVICLLLLMLTGVDGRDARMLTGMVFFVSYLVIVVILFSVSTHRRAILLALASNSALWTLWYFMGGQL